MNTTHRQNLVLWAVFTALHGVVAMMFARGAAICMTASGATIEELSPWTWWAFAALAAIAFGLALGLFALARIRSDRAPCPHCGKDVEPRVTMLGELKMVAPPSTPAGG